MSGEITVNQGASRGLLVENSADRPKGTIRGEQYVMDWIQSAIEQGYGFTFDVGDFSTPVVGGGDGTVMDLDQPEVGLLIPSTKVVYLTKVIIDLLAPLIAADDDEMEALLLADVAAATAAAALDGTWTSTLTDAQVKNMRLADTNRANTACTVKTLCTADTTDPTEYIELHRDLYHADVQGTAANALWQKGKFIYEPKHPLPIVGPAVVFAYWGGTVATFAFAHFEYLEFPAAEKA